MLGIINRRPCEAVNVVVIAPACSAPWTAPAAPPSLCISVTEGTVPQMLCRPSAAHASDHSPIGEEGVIGYMAMTSLVRNATYAAASLPSIVTICLVMIFYLEFTK